MVTETFTRPSIEAQYITAIILYAAAYVYALKFAVSIQKCETEACKKFKDVHEGCLMGCPSGAEVLTSARGGNYYIGANDPAQQNSLKGCFATFWSGTHFMLYLLLGYFCPDLFWHTFIIGASFEYYEKHAFDCADPLDVLFNTTGFLLGRFINETMMQN